MFGIGDSMMNTVSQPPVRKEVSIGERNGQGHQQAKATSEAGPSCPDWPYFYVT